MRAYRADGRGRAAYDPAMMVALLLYAYARGTRSSRAIERACEEDVAFRVIAAQQRPDHATIARFVERHQDALAGVFGEVLRCARGPGWSTVAVIAVDGTKVHANASRRRDLDYEQIAREILAEAEAVDAAEDERLRRRRGDELPEQLAHRRGPARVAARSQAPTRRAPRRRRRGRSRARRASDCKEAKRRLEEELCTEMPRQRRLRAPTGRVASTRRGAGSAARRIPTRRPRCRRGRSTSLTPTRAS